MIKISIVIPTFNNYKGVHQLLWDIYCNCSIPDEIIVMDDNSYDPEVQTGLEWWMSQDMLPIKHVRNKSQLGFLKNSNKGLKSAKGDVICLISTDVRIHEDLVAYPYVDDELWGGRYLSWDTGWNTFNGHTFPYLEGWLLTATKKAWKQLGYFDDRYAPNDMEDVDISTQAVSQGMFLRSYPVGSVHHIGAQSIPYSPEREKITIENKRKFEDKWVKKVKA